MSTPTHVLGSTTISATPYGVRKEGVRGFSSPPLQYDKQRKAQRDGESIQRAYRLNKERAVTVKVTGADKDTVLANVQALEQEVVGISQAEPLLYQYTPADATKVNYLDVYGAYLEYDPDDISEREDVFLNVDIVMETDPDWYGAWEWFGTTNLMPYALATGDELDPTDDPPTGLGSAGGGTTSITATTTASPRSGNWHFLVNPDGAAASQGLQLASSHWIRVSTSTDYVFSLYAKKADGTPATASMTIEINWVGTDGSSVSQTTANDTITTSYSRVEVTGTSPSNAAFVNLLFYHNGTSAENFLVDDMQFELGTSATAYSDPATEIAPTNNFFTDNQASVETDTTGFTSIDGGGGGATLTRDTSESAFDDASLKAVTSGSANDGFYSDTPTLSTTTMAGKDWTYSVYLKHNGSSPANDYAATLKTGTISGGAYVGSATQGVTVTDTMTRYEVTYTVPAGISSAVTALRGQVTSDAGGKTFYADGQMIEPASSASRFVMPGPLIGQDSFTVPGDLPTELAMWVEPVGDITSEVYLGLRNQQDEGAPNLVFDISEEAGGAQRTVNTTESTVWTGPLGNDITMAVLKGKYRVLAQLTATAAATDYQFRWIIGQNTPTGNTVLGDLISASSSVLPQWMDLGLINIPPFPVPGRAEDDYWASRINIQGVKGAGSGICNVWRLLLVPEDNGVAYQKGVSSNTDFGTLSLSSVGSDTVGYQYFAGGFTLPPSWPTVETDLSTEHSLSFGSFIAGPGTTDMVLLAKENSQSLLKVRWVGGCYPRYRSPVIN